MKEGPVVVQGWRQRQQTGLTPKEVGPCGEDHTEALSPAHLRLFHQEWYTGRRVQAGEKILTTSAQEADP